MAQIGVYWIIEIALIFSFMITSSGIPLLISIFLILGTWCFEAGRYMNYFDTHYHEEYRKIVNSSRSMKAGFKAQMEFIPEPPDEELKRRQVRFRFFLHSVCIWFFLNQIIVIIKIILKITL